MNHVIEKDVVTESPLTQRYSPHTLGLFCLALTLVTWSFGPSISANVSTHPLVSTFLRMTGAAIAQWIICTIIKRRPTLQLLKQALLPGALFCLNNTLFFFAVHQSSVANATLLVSLQPVVVILLAKPLFGEVVHRRDIVCTLIALSGAGFAILAANSNKKGHPTTVIGVLTALASMLAFCGYFLIAKHQNTKMKGDPPHPLTYMTTIVTAAAITSLPFVIFTGHASDLAHITATQSKWIGLVIAVPTLGHLGVTYAHRHVEATLSSLILLIQPVSSAFVAWWMLHQRVVIQQVIGAVIVISAIGVVTIRRQNAANPRTPASKAPESELVATGI
jgi:drug/metabolite transporter (DMT)-like permease